MNEAISNAKETLPVFEQHWKRSEVESCNIKLALKTNTDQLEHIWFTPIQIIGDKVTAKCE